jgi:hypothetical protein
LIYFSTLLVFFFVNFFVISCYFLLFLVIFCYEFGFFVTWYGSIGGINRLNPYLARDLID